ncbi:methyltransferase [Marasmius crinis-equi]|uniref:mRNA m(6)A methyltransferase n=1 Tax=Marasmius crinis-equi TaxID=585013 RepID=A0ABR3G269_9AGAR
MSANERLKIVTTTALHRLVGEGKLSTPISSKQLLVRVIAFKPPHDLFPDASTPPRFRLTDLSLFENVLEDIARQWDQGELCFTRDKGELTVTDIVLPNGQAASSHSASCSISTLNLRKRKHVIDEEADSAAGDEPEDLSGEQNEAPVTGLSRLSKEQREVYTLLQRSTAKGRLLAEQFRSQDGAFEPICPHITKDECAKARKLDLSLTQSSSSSVVSICDRVHFRPLIRAHTDPSLGHCSYLNTCYSEPTYAQSPSIPPFPGQNHVLAPGARGPTSLPSGLGAGGRGKEKAPCRYLHYEVDWDGNDGDQWPRHNGRAEGIKKKTHKLGIGLGPTGKIGKPWINCDLRRFDYSVLGKFHVIMADPPWDIHMSLPYGTMTDDEMRAMPIPMLQDEGLLFLWVTGRAMEVGRECLRVWGYTRIDEVVWVKTNQLQRVIRTGRTGHWLNHTKEHMLVGVKTNLDEKGELKIPSWVNRGLDTDVIVSEVRETSRKPDEAYGLIERMCPGGRKVEIFGRKHNTRPGWLTLGNQLGPDQIYEEELLARIRAK